MPEFPQQPPVQVPTFVGKYRIVRMIARSNDTVYEAIDPNLGRRVALKELTLPHDVTGAARRERIERFQREAKAAGALKHPNIVTIYEVGQHLEHRFIAMEYLEGQTLREAMSIGGPMAISEAVRIALQLCDALGAAHAQGVVHRDVKPDNIHLVPPNNMVKLTDFGIARVLSEPSITSAGQVFGTPSYMSPEQLTSRQVDHRSDIFSTAVVIYEMIAGKKPFRGDNVVAVTYQIMNTQVEMPPSIPTGIAGILAKALAKDPDLRYQNMRTFAADLRREMPRGDVSTALLPGAGASAFDPFAKTVSIVGAEPTRAAGPTQAIASAAQATTVGTVLQPRSLIASMDASEALRRSLARLIFSGAVSIFLIAVTVWAALAVLQRFHENTLHERGLTHYRQAVQAAASGNLAVAIASYKAAMHTVEANDRLFDLSREGISDCDTAQGAHEQTLGNLLSAQESYNEAIAMDFNNPVAHFDLGTLYQLKGDPINALREFSLSYQAGPLTIAGIRALAEAQQGYLQLGEQDFSTGNLNRARQNWQHVIDLGGDSATADEARQKMQQLTQ